MDLSELQFTDTPLESPITEVALLLIGVQNSGTVYAIGSAFITAPYIGITATHVMKEFWARMGTGEQVRDGAPIEAAFGVFAIQYAGSSTTANVWNVANAVCSLSTDIAFLEMVPENDGAKAYQFARTPNLSLRPPAPGQPVAAFGFPGSRGELLRSTDLQLHVRPKTSAGFVTQVYEEYRDRSMLHFPCFEVDCRFDGGMSGGPVFNAEGQCCGVIYACRDYGDGRYVSFATTLWPALWTKLNFATPNIVYKAPYQVGEL